MDEYDDYDELDEMEDDEIDEMEGLDRDFDEDDEEMDESDDFDEAEDVIRDRIMDAEQKGYLDGESAADLGQGRYVGFGASLDDENKLSEEEREAYEQGYEDGYISAGGQV